MFSHTNRRTDRQRDKERWEMIIACTKNHNWKKWGNWCIYETHLDLKSLPGVNKDPGKEHNLSFSEMIKSRARNLLSVIVSIMKWTHPLCSAVKHRRSYHFWTVAGYKSSKIFLQVAQNNIGWKWYPAARQGPIYKPTRSELNPDCSYNSTGAFWWLYHPMLLLVGFRGINRPGNHITDCWLSSLGECTRWMVWGWSNGDTEGYAEFPPGDCLGCGVRLNEHWGGGLGWAH